MQEAKHTPTPWRISNKFCDVRIVAGKPDDTDTIAVMGNWTPEFFEEQDANVHFIVTAVNAHEEMLAALQRVTKWLIRCAEADEERAKDTRFSTLSEACTADAKNYRATAKDLQGAIDKARGK